MKKYYRITVEYDGTDFSGWQRQPGGVPTVQGAIEDVLCTILREPVRITGSGRTDRGVHAMGQVAGFSTSSALTPGRLCHAMNCLLPSTVRIRELVGVSADFHPRYSAHKREYRYVMRSCRSAIFGRFSGFYQGVFDIERFNLAAREFYGTHDFGAFSKQGSDPVTTICTVYRAEWVRELDYHVFIVEASRFLRSMVRFLVAATIRLEPETVRSGLASGRLDAPLRPADPQGLFLWSVSYGNPLEEGDSRPVPDGL